MFAAARMATRSLARLTVSGSDRYAATGTATYNKLSGTHMSSFLKGLLAGFLIGFLVIGLFGVVTWLVGRGGPGVPSEVALVLELEGGIPEQMDPDLSGFFMGRDAGSPVSLYAMTEAIRKAAGDDRVEALVLHCDGSSAGWAKAQELRWAILDFKKSKKPVWAYLATAGREGYYIASVADHLVVQPEGFLYLTGLRAEVMYFKNSLEKLGVEVDLVRSGKYKSAGEPFIQERMSPESREVVDATLDEFFGQLLDGISEGRGRDPEHWQAVLDEGPYSSAQAKEYGLVDEILYQDEFYERLSDAVAVEEIRRVGVARYAGNLSDSAHSGKKFAMFHAVGTITSGSSWTDPLDGQQERLGADTFSAHVEHLRKDEDIDGIILRIDSPGGDAIASERMLHDVRRLSEEKPVVVSMSTMAASGGYYIASIPDVPIIAYPGTYTGSIGVFTVHLNIRGLYDKLGITKEILQRGRYAAADSDYKSMTPEERARLSGFVDGVYETFVSRVSEGRGIDVDSVEDLAQGRLWIGAQAFENGLVDELGGYTKAIELLRAAVGIDADDPVSIVQYPPRRSLVESLISRATGSGLGPMVRRSGLKEVSEAWRRAVIWSEFLADRPVYMAPYTLTIY